MDKSYFEAKNIEKETIESLINQGELNKAVELINQFEKKYEEDIEILNLKAIIAIIQEDFNLGLNYLLKAREIDFENVDVLYNLGFVFEKIGEYDGAYQCYELVSILSENTEIREQVLALSQKLIEEKKVNRIYKLAIFVKENMDNFLDDIEIELSKKYDVQKIIVNNSKKIDEGMKWADICWFEWCDELIVYGSKHKLANSRQIICRLHRYEAFSDYIKKVEWENIDKVIFVAEHIRDKVIQKVRLPIDKCEVVYNGINKENFLLKERTRGYNLALVGYLNMRKNPMLIIQCLYQLVKIDKRYKLFIAGDYQDEMLKDYIDKLVEKLNLKENIQYDGFIPNTELNKWLEDKQYIVTGSIGEGHPVGVMESMASGLKPIIHYFPGCEKFYPSAYIYKNIDEFVNIVIESEYDSSKYYDWIISNYSLDRQLKSIANILKDTESKCQERTRIHDDKVSIKNNNDVVVESEVVNYYNEFLDYLKYDRERENPRHTYLKNRLSQIIKKGDSVLDLGCGIGITTEHINSLGVSRVLGVDLSPELINYARETVKNIEFIIHDITTFYCNEKFDVISLCDVVEHIPRDRYEDLFKVIKNHIKREGIVFISIPDPDYQEYVRACKPEELQIIDNSIFYEEVKSLAEKVDLKIRFFNGYGVFIKNQYNEYILCDKEEYQSQWHLINSDN